MAEETDFPQFDPISAYCLMIVIKAKEAHVPQIWQ
jgi:hypothetical protein